MAKSGGIPGIVYVLLVLALAGGGYWFFSRDSPPQPQGRDVVTPADLPSAPLAQAPQPSASGIDPPSALPAGTPVRIEGSTTMVTINQGFKDGFESQFPGTTVTARATGSREGIAALLRGEADIAASSRPLTETEKSQGLMAMPVATDAIAVVVGGNNPYRRSLTPEQVRQIFQGKITDWSAVGGSAGEIRVINRPPVSGTHQVFRELVLDGAEFGTTPNIAQMDRDATTPLLQGLGTDGIGYATYAQVANQQTVRVVPIAGLTPEAPNYPYQRQLFYVYSYPPTAAVKAFLGYIKSAAGQAIIEDK